MTAEALVSDRVRPFWGYGRATVIESAVDEAQRRSGLVVPLAFDGDDGISRGVILHVVYAPGGETGDLLTPGRVVFYRTAVQIADVYVVDLEDVIAYEEDH